MKLLAKLRGVDPIVWWIISASVIIVTAFALLHFQIRQPIDGTFKIEREEDITDNTTLRVVRIGGRRFVVVNGVNKVAVCPW